MRVCSLWWGATLLTRDRCGWPRRSLRSIGALASASLKPLVSATQANTAVAADIPSSMAVPGDPLQVVQGKNSKLRRLIKTLRWPAPASFDVNGRNYELPVTSQSRTAARFRGLPARLRYLAGFFDGDGCVQGRKSWSGCSLTVAQSFARPEVLMLFLSSFAGSVRRQSDGVGFCQPALVWSVHGLHARSAASALAPYSITKRRQLELAASWPRDENHREECKRQLCSLKQTDSAAAGAISREYLAGFFDAEGCVQHRGGLRLQIQIKQKFGTVLECLQEFLAHDLGIGVRVAKYSGYWVLHTARRSNCTAMLHAMLEAGLVCKAEQARLCLKLTAQNASDIRSALAEQKGNQSFGKRLDEDGLRRCRRIEAAQKQVKWSKTRGKQSEARTQAEKVEVLQAEHKLLKSLHENQQLCEYAAKIQSLCGTAGVGAHQPALETSGASLLLRKGASGSLP